MKFVITPDTGKWKQEFASLENAVNACVIRKNTVMYLEISNDKNVRKVLKTSDGKVSLLTDIFLFYDKKIAEETQKILNNWDISNIDFGRKTIKYTLVDKKALIPGTWENMEFIQECWKNF